MDASFPDTIKIICTPQNRPTQYGVTIHTPPQQTKHPHLTTSCRKAESATA
jgi:hypothetical protein